MTELCVPRAFHYATNPALAYLVLISALAATAAGCGESDPSPDPDLGTVDQGPTGTFTGGECGDASDCAGGACLVGFERLGAEEFDGSLFPDGYCSVTECTDDDSCGDDAGCLTRPEDLESVCLRTCSAPADCRDGYTCAAVPGSTDTRTFCLYEEPELCTHNAAWEQAGTCILRYAIADGDAQFEITGTNLGLGDAVFDVGPGELVIRTTGDSVEVTDGAAGVLCYDLRQNFRNMQGVITYTRGSAVSTTGAVLASGTLASSVITWDTCTYSDTYGVSVSSWTPEETATGPGCLADYRSQGDVNCAAGTFICGVGNLQVGHNIQDGMWIQPLNSFELGDDFSLTMAGLDRPAESTVDDKVEVPNSSPSRTYLGFTSTLVSTTCY